MLRRPALLAALLAALLLAPLPAAAQTAGAGVRVEVDPVRAVAFRRTVPVLGRVVALQSGPVAARAAGPVAEVLVDVGTRVEAGAVLARLDGDRPAHAQRQAEAAVAQRRAAIAEADAQAALAETDLRRLEGLRKSSAFSPARYDEAVQAAARWRAAAAAARATLAAAEAEAALAALTVREGEIRAPFAGVVATRHIQPGAWLAAGAPVVTLIDDRTLELEVEATGAWLAGLAPGTAVTARPKAATPDSAATAEGSAATEGSAGGPDLAATLRAVVPQEDPRTRTRLARFTLAEPPPPGLAPGQSVTLALPVGDGAPVLSVHKDAVIGTAGGQVVYVVEDGIAQPRPVDLGPAVGDRFAVRAGLREGDRAVVRGNERLRPGQAVILPAADSPSGKGGS